MRGVYEWNAGLERTGTRLEQDWNKKRVNDMSRFCLGTFFTAIKKCVDRGFVQGRDFREVFATMALDYDPEADMIVHIVGGRKNPSKDFIDIIDSYDQSEYVKFCSCMSSVSDHIDPNKIDLLEMLFTKIVAEDETISDDTVVDLVNGTTKKNLPGNYTDLSSFLTGLFIYVVKYTDNKDKSVYVKEIDDRYVAMILAEISDKKKPSNKSDDTLTELDMLQARSFIVSHEKEMELIPLCHIAYLYRPQHQHVRPMYTEYNLLPLKIRKHILKLSKSSQIMKIKSLHIGEAMSAFLEDLIKYELGSESYMYLFNQYFCRAFRYYANCDIEQYDMYSFPRLCRTDIVSCKSGSLSSLDTYINDYLWLRDKGKTNDISCPLECLFIEKKLDSCSEEELTFWLCRFVIDACINLICMDQPTEHDVDDQYAETQEDLYYCALYWLERFYRFRHS